MEAYAECHRISYSGKIDGCQQFMATRGDAFKCQICECHRNFHRRLTPLVVYTKCHKIHEFKSQVSVDGCQEFTPTAEKGAGALVCAICGCNKGFHRNEITFHRNEITFHCSEKTTERT